MATGAAGVPDSIQAAAGFVPNRTPAQGSRLLVTLSCYIDPYPMVKTADGSLSIAWLDRAWAVAFITPVISMILALFEKGCRGFYFLSVAFYAWFSHTDQCFRMGFEAAPSRFLKNGS